MAWWQNPDFVKAVTAAPVPEEELKFFQSVDWANKAWLENPEFKPIRFLSRDPKGDAQDEVIAKTLHTKHTVPHWLAMLRDGALTTNAGALWRPAHTGGATPPTPMIDPDMVLLVDVQPGLSGFLDTLHGGISCTLLDESMSFCAELQRHARTPPNERSAMFTANLNVSFRQPVPLPEVFVIKCKLDARDGRKWYLSGQMCDQQGRILVTAEGLWISTRPQKL